MGSFDQSVPRRCGADDASLPSENELLLCKGGQLAETQGGLHGGNR
jgi:hypothetical protein